MSDPMLSAVPSPLRAGAFRNSAVMQIHSHQAIELFHGRRADAKAIEPWHRYSVPGLLLFAKILREVWQCAERDDPYADWLLLHVERALQRARTFIRLELEALATQHTLMPETVTLGVCTSEEPVSVPLDFNTPYGFQGAYLIADYDALVRRAETARRTGALVRADHDHLLRVAGRRVRRVFRAVLHHWNKHVPVTREDLLQNNARAQAAIQAMGELPSDIISAATRAEMAPPRRITADGKTDTALA